MKSSKSESISLEMHPLHQFTISIQNISLKIGILPDTATPNQTSIIIGHNNGILLALQYAKPIQMFNDKNAEHHKENAEKLKYHVSILPFIVSNINITALPPTVFTKMSTPQTFAYLIDPKIFTFNMGINLYSKAGLKLCADKHSIHGRPPESLLFQSMNKIKLNTDKVRKAVFKMLLVHWGQCNLALQIPQIVYIANESTIDNIYCHHLNGYINYINICKQLILAHNRFVAVTGAPLGQSEKHYINTSQNKKFIMLLGSTKKKLINTFNTFKRREEWTKDPAHKLYTNQLPSKISMIQLMINRNILYPQWHYKKNVWIPPFLGTQPMIQSTDASPSPSATPWQNETNPLDNFSVDGFIKKATYLTSCAYLEYIGGSRDNILPHLLHDTVEIMNVHRFIVTKPSHVAIYSVGYTNYIFIIIIGGLKNGLICISGANVENIKPFICRIPVHCWPSITGTITKRIHYFYPGVNLLRIDSAYYYENQPLSLQKYLILYLALNATNWLSVAQQKLIRRYTSIARCRILELSTIEIEIFSKTICLQWITESYTKLSTELDDDDDSNDDSNDARSDNSHNSEENNNAHCDNSDDSDELPFTAIR